MKVIDATNRTIGRVATEAAMALMGKDKASYTPNVEPKEKVVIDNASKVKILDRKLKMKKYSSYSGYPGSLRFASLEEVIEKKGHGEALKKAIRNMLPKNKLRAIMLKNLTIND